MNVQDCVLLIDSMNDDFNRCFKAWPTGYFLVSPQNELLYSSCSAERDNSMNYDSFDVRELFTFMRRNLAQGKSN